MDYKPERVILLILWAYRKDEEENEERAFANAKDSN
jgi:hypothetical protein